MIVTVRGAAIALAGIGLLGSLWPVWPALVVHGETERLGYLPLGSRQRFTVSFTHSIDGLPVEDGYTVREGRVVQERTRVRQFGAGMGHIPGHGTGAAAGQWWEITGLDRDIGELVVRVGRAPVQHRLRSAGGDVALSRCWPRERLTITPTRIPTLARLFPSAISPGCRAAADAENDAGEVP